MSRDRILASIRTGLAEAAQGKQSTADALHARWAPHVAPGDYQRVGLLAREERIGLFAERLREYGADFVTCAAEQDVPASLAELLRARGKTTLALPPAFPEHLLPGDDGFTWLRDEPPLSNAQLDAVDGVVTLASTAIAISGSVALQHGPTEGRRVLTLLPDFHLCVVREHQLVETLPVALERLYPTATRPTTFFSGPSATADIEMTRIKGVHGPRFLAVLLILD